MSSELRHPVIRIVSGGQTCVDRGALDAAIALGISHGGWCPRGRLAEDGRIPAQYELEETLSSDYPIRTEQNVIDSDGTLILFRERMHGGTQLTRRLAEKHLKPVLAIDLAGILEDGAYNFDEVRRWLSDNSVAVLNVAGPRESSSVEIATVATTFVRRLLSG